MLAKRFFYVCAGLFLLALTYHLGAGRAIAQSGAVPAVAVLAGTVTDGGTIPLPHFADGTEALESECRWIVSTNTSGSAGQYVGFACYTTGRWLPSPRPGQPYFQCGELSDYWHPRYRTRERAAAQPRPLKARFARRAGQND